MSAAKLPSFAKRSTHLAVGTHEIRVHEEQEANGIGVTLVCGPVQSGAAVCIQSLNVGVPTNLVQRTKDGRCSETARRDSSARPVAERCRGSEEKAHLEVIDACRMAVLSSYMAGCIAASVLPGAQTEVVRKQTAGRWIQRET